MSGGDWIPWAFIGLMAAFFVYTRFVGKASPSEARALVANGGALLDVRTPGEFAAGHLEGARNIPVDQLPARLGEVGPKETPVVVYCRSGARSGRAASLLRSAGFARVEDVGPMSRW
jgi:phage shock protein E